MSGKEIAAIAGFEGREVAAFESRRAKEMATLISHQGGRPRVVPSMREVPLEQNPAAFVFADKLFARQIDAVILMTGVGTQTLVEVLETRFPREKIVEALSKVTVVARGPKPVKVLHELKVPVTLTIPEPNTWREILQELDENPRGFSLEGSRVAVQEYGVTNEAFLRGLKDRGAHILRVPVYRWALPEDVGPLQQAVEAIVEGRIRIVLFTNSAQAEHLLQVATFAQRKDQLIPALRNCVVGSVGPTCTEALLGQGITVDLEPEHPRMGALVLEAAQRAQELLKKKSGVRSPRAEGTATSTAVAETAGPKAAAPKPAWENSRFLKACRLEPADATPIWLMRQAGRYMKEYRDLRAKVPFLELCKNPDLVAEVTITAAERLGVDAAIIFADLLLIVEPLGYHLEYDKGEGPVIAPVLRQPRDVDRLREVIPQESLGYLYEAIRKTRAQLNPKLPLIGFAGCPFTLASYLIEGGGSKNYVHTKSLMYHDPGAWRALMEHLARSLALYINGQIDAGVQAVQVFDTWVGCLGPADYREFVFPYTRLMIQGVTPGVPVIHFGTGNAMLLEAMRDAGGNIIGVDSRVELDEAWARVGFQVGVQGNLDPIVLFADSGYIRQRVERILQQAGGRPGHIFNLGHGILPNTPLENVLELVRLVHELSGR